MANHNFNLAEAARRDMAEHGFEPDFPRDAEMQAAEAHTAPWADLRDLSSLAWSSIDNDDSRDLDQIEWAERVPEGIRVRVAVADVDAVVAKDTPIDRHAACETTSVYTGVRTFPMLPERLSTGLTSLNENEDRAALVIEFVVAPDGSLGENGVYRARVRNLAQLTYSGVGAWLEARTAAPAKVAKTPGLEAQIRLQDEAAAALREQRHRLGALSFDRQEVQPILANGKVQGIATHQSNRAAHLIEDFMIAANEVMAQTLAAAGVSSIRRVVKDPERWPRIVELAAGYGEKLPAEPDSGALNRFLVIRRQADPLHYPDLSIAVLKLMGPGEYVLSRAGDPGAGHFGLAAHDYTHSTAPNRRFADLVTERLLKAAESRRPAPYTDEELDAIARNCTLKEDAARKVQRDMTKRIAAVAMQHRVGETFTAVVTGVTHKGVFVRALTPPVEGRLMNGEQGLDVGDRLHVRLLAADPERGYIDFGRTS